MMLLGASYHVKCSPVGHAEEGERDECVCEPCHLLVAYRAGSLAVHFPVGREVYHLEMMSPSVSFAQGISSPCVTADDDHLTVRVVQLVGQYAVAFRHQLIVVAVVS